MLASCRLDMSRRGFLLGAGALVVSLSSLARAQEGEVAGSGSAEEEAPELPGSLSDAPFLDSWIRIDADGAVSAFTGKAELGQGIRTALLQVVAEELEVEPAAIRLVTADTGLTPNEGYTAGSQSMPNSATALRHAAAQARELLLAEAGRRLSLPSEALRVENGAVLAEDGRRVPFADLVSGTLLHVEASPESRLKDPSALRVIGTELPRVDIPGKLTGAESYVQDMRPPGMLHARIVRPPSAGARLADLDARSVEAMPGVVAVVRDGSFLAVAAETEWQAIKAMRALAGLARWEETESLPDAANLSAVLRSMPAEDGIVAEAGTRAPDLAQTYEAWFTRPYQAHGSIGPSCALAEFRDGAMTVWTHTQGVYPDRAAIAEMLGLPEDKVRCIHREGAGCYGHNGADDAAADAALVARALPGRPVRVQWTREQEFSGEPFGPAMVTHLSAGLDGSGRIAGWDYELWSNIHSTRPGPAGSLLPARHLAAPFAPEPPELEITPSGNGDRNSDPLYDLSNRRVVWHFLRDMPLRVSALRALGAYANVFSIESGMDELALLAGADPVAFRLAHLSDPRARAVVELAADRFGWSAEPLPAGRGRGFAFARYKNLAAYLALAVEAEVERESGRVRIVRAVCALDAGEIVSPDGLRNQTEGGILQSMSWTLFEAVSFDRTRITSLDWATYPILRFSDVPDSVEVHLIERPGDPFLGAGEAAQGPTPAAIANAIRDATGRRITDLPFTRERVKAAIGV